LREKSGKISLRECRARPENMGFNEKRHCDRSRRIIVETVACAPESSGCGPQGWSARFAGYFQPRAELKPFPEKTSSPE
jgi:hypothetical protein